MSPEASAGGLPLRGDGFEQIALVEDTYSISEVAALLGLRQGVVKKLCREGKIPCREEGGNIVIPVPAFIEWLGGEQLGLDFT